MGVTCLKRRQCLYVDPLAAARLVEQKKIPAASVTLKQACDVSVSDGERSANGRKASLTKEEAKVKETSKKGKRTRKKG